MNKNPSDGEESADSEGLSGSARRWLYRFRFPLLIVAIGLLEACVVSSQLPFIKITWFARRHSEHAAEDLNCNDTPKLLACKQGAADLAYWDGILSGISGIASVFFAIALGSFSDVTGRRTVLIAKGVLGSCKSFVLLAVVLLDFSLWDFLVADTIDKSFDVTGVWVAMLADLTQDSRSQRGPIMGMAIVLVIVLSCIFFPLGSLLSYSVATVLSAVFALLGLLLVILVLPETYPVASANIVSCSILLKEMRGSWAILNRHSFMQKMVAVLTMGGVAYAGKQVILKPYLIAHFGLDKKHLALLLPICAPSMGVCFSFGLWKGVPHFGEVTILQLSFFANSLMTLGTIVAMHTWQLLVVYATLAGPALLFIPLINSIKSNLVHDSEQGKVQGLIGAIRAFAVSFADVFFGALYKWVTQGGKNTENAKSILVLVLCLVLAAALVTMTLPSKYPEPIPSEEVSDAQATEEVQIVDTRRESMK